MFRADLKEAVPVLGKPAPMTIYPFELDYKKELN